ncbi:GNAT family N-acetyltransferase [Auraticoccus sp. F435]|uniref:GNAT family N-acetyltransferase n=1 Tax=Auraticoccus cholistanensis TaxID=2656650 RepID=A0A6A9UVU7_9ACTN|nr:GNAT family N-acetyltransferase [Auraticoccus cholistanensis]MVA76841.1 GNAT family N-acetyltransferase [Auraticoccus cholistanensis]
MAQLTLVADLSGDPITLTTRLAPSALPLGVQLRAAAEDDAAEVARLRLECHPSGGGAADLATATSEVRSRLGGGYGPPLEGGCQVAVDEQGGVVACVLAVASSPWPELAGSPCVLDLFTAPPWRGRGLGRALLVESMRAAAASADRIGLRVDDADGAAVSLCRSLGFTEAG